MLIKAGRRTVKEPPPPPQDFQSQSKYTTGRRLFYIICEAGVLNGTSFLMKGHWPERKMAHDAVGGDSESPPSSSPWLDVICPLWPRFFSSLQDTLHPALQNHVKSSECFCDLLPNKSHPTQ